MAILHCKDTACFWCRSGICELDNVLVDDNRNCCSGTYVTISKIENKIK